MTYSPVLKKDGVTYTVAGVSGATGLKSNSTTDTELGSKSY